MKLPIYDITPHTLIDYEGKIAAIVWFAGCPLRCAYCHNPHMVFSKGSISADEALIFLSKRLGWNEGVVLSGGECLAYAGIERFCMELKSLGFAVKIDTGGLYPKKMAELATKGLIDDVAIDFKATKEKFYSVCGINGFYLFKETLFALLRSKVAVSVRTTVYADMICEEELSQMSQTLFEAGYKGVYTIQKAIIDKPTLANLRPPTASFDPKKINSKLPLRFIGF